MYPKCPTFTSKNLLGRSIDYNKQSLFQQLTLQIKNYVQENSQSDELLSKKLQLRSALLSVIRKKYPGRFPSQSTLLCLFKLLKLHLELQLSF